jgi:hypothetical protein
METPITLPVRNNGYYEWPPEIQRLLQFPNPTDRRGDLP